MKLKINKYAALIAILILSAGLVLLPAYKCKASDEKHGNIIADSYRFYANQNLLADGKEFDIAIVFVDAEPSENDHLVSVYLSGKDIKKIAELYASYFSEITPGELYASGFTYEYNIRRPKLDKLSDIYLSPSMLEHSRSEMDYDVKYRVVTDTHSIDVINKLSGYSLGMMKINPEALANVTTVNGADGAPAIPKDAYEKYVSSFSGELSEINYDSLEMRRIVSASFGPAAYFKNSSIYLFIYIGIVIAIIIIAVIITHVTILNKHKKKVFVE